MLNESSYTHCSYTSLYHVSSNFLRPLWLYVSLSCFINLPTPTVVIRLVIMFQQPSYIYTCCMSPYRFSPTYTVGVYLLIMSYQASYIPTAVGVCPLAVPHQPSYITIAGVHLLVMSHYLPTSLQQVSIYFLCLLTFLHLYSRCPSPCHVSLPFLHLYSRCPSPCYVSLHFLHLYSRCPSHCYVSLPFLHLYSRCPSPCYVSLPFPHPYSRCLSNCYVSLTFLHLYSGCLLVMIYQPFTSIYQLSIYLPWLINNLHIDCMSPIKSHQPVYIPTMVVCIFIMSHHSYCPGTGLLILVWRCLFPYLL